MSAGLLPSGSTLYGPLSGQRAAAFQFDIVNPHGMNLKTWAHAFIFVLSPRVALPWLTDEASFERWATEIAQDPALTPFNLPYPQGRPWQEWALSVNNALSTAASG